MSMPYTSQPNQGHVQPNQGHVMSPQAQNTIKSLQFWLKFFGIFSIVYGVIYCLTLVGIVVGWLPLLLGFWLYKSGDRLASFQRSSNIQELEESLGQMRNFWMVSGILTLIWLMLMIGMVVMYVIFGAAMLALVGLGAAAQ